jgi:hypothetical protein
MGFIPNGFRQIVIPAKLIRTEAELCHVTKAEAGIQKSKLGFTVSSTGQAYQVRHNI